jgi:hypothetical protein
VGADAVIIDYLSNIKGRALGLTAHRPITVFPVPMLRCGGSWADGEEQRCIAARVRCVAPWGSTRGVHALVWGAAQGIKVHLHTHVSTIE